MKKLMLIICLIAFFSNENFAQSELSSEERKVIEQAVKLKSQEFWELFTKDYSEQNLNRLMDLFVKTEDVAWMNKPAIHLNSFRIIYSKEELKDLLSRVFELRHSSPTTIIENYFAVISNDVVVEILTNENYIITADGNRSPDYETGNTTVWVLRNDEWKILHWHRTNTEKE